MRIYKSNFIQIKRAVLTIFVGFTIMAGLGLGIGLIICIDCVFPPKKYSGEGLDKTIPEVNY